MTVEENMLDVENLKTKSVFEIKSFAKNNDIDLKDAKTREQMLKILEGKEVVKIAKTQNSEKVALFSDNSKHSINKEFGILKNGYNIVNKEAANWWLTRKGVRLATPHELARYYGIE
jgi:hypothetical protein